MKEREPSTQRTPSMHLLWGIWTLVGISEFDKTPMATTQIIMD